MARNTEAVPNTFAFRKKLLSWVDEAYNRDAIIFLLPFPEILRLVLCVLNADGVSARSSWLNSTPLPNDSYLSPRINSLCQPLYVLAVLMAILSPVCSIAFFTLIFRREATYTGTILVIAVTTISIVVAAIVLALQILIQPSLDMQTILKIRPDLTSEDVLTAWRNSTTRLAYTLFAFILFLVTGGFQIMAVSARHLISSRTRLPKQFQPFVIEKHKRKSAIGEPEASTLGTELVASVEPGPLARMFDGYKERGLISTHIDLEVCRSNKAITSRSLHSLYRLLTLPDLE